eukprot:scaffold4394_cov113-Isochrysis_galbana.AAC.6
MYLPLLEELLAVGGMPATACGSMMHDTMCRARVPSSSIFMVHGCRRQTARASDHIVDRSARASSAQSASRTRLE